MLLSEALRVVFFFFFSLHPQAHKHFVFTLTIGSSSGFAVLTLPHVGKTRWDFNYLWWVDDPTPPAEPQLSLDNVRHPETLSKSSSMVTKWADKVHWGKQEQS